MNRQKVKHARSKHLKVVCGKGWDEVRTGILTGILRPSSPFGYPCGVNEHLCVCVECDMYTKLRSSSPPRPVAEFVALFLEAAELLDLRHQTAVPLTAALRQPVPAVLVEVLCKKTKIVFRDGNSANGFQLFECRHNISGNNLILKIAEYYKLSIEKHRVRHFFCGSERYKMRENLFFRTPTQNGKKGKKGKNWESEFLNYESTKILHFPIPVMLTFPLGPVKVELVAGRALAGRRAEQVGHLAEVVVAGLQPNFLAQLGAVGEAGGRVRGRLHRTDGQEGGDAHEQQQAGQGGD